MTTPSVVVIGGGIAGVGAAYALAQAGSPVTLLEAESTLAYHSTGRSAAIYFENYGAAANRALTTASRRFFDEPPPGLVDHPLLERRGAMWIGTTEQESSLRAHLAESETSRQPGRWLGPLQACALVPVLRPDYLVGAVLEPEALDLDVAGLHQAFVRGLRAAGGEIRPTARVESLTKSAMKWSITAGADHLEADVIVNAAGAWADTVAILAGADPLGLEPRRRTAFMVPGNLAYRGLAVGWRHRQLVLLSPRRNAVALLAGRGEALQTRGCTSRRVGHCAGDRPDQRSDHHRHPQRSLFVDRTADLRSRSGDGDWLGSAGRGTFLARRPGRNRDSNRSGGWPTDGRPDRRRPAEPSSPSTRGRRRRSQSQQVQRCLRVRWDSQISISRSGGSAWAVRPLNPVMVSAAQSAFQIDSSVASIVASISGSM